MHPFVARIEDGLGTLGADMLGLGPKNTPIKQAPGWKRLTTEEKFQLDLDWRQKLSGENLDAAETKEFISLWASANKYGARHAA